MDSQKIKQIFALANEFKEGDVSIGGTRDDRLRLEARGLLGSLRLGDIGRATLVDDGVSDALARSLDASLSAELSELTVAGLKDALLGPNGAAWARRCRDGLSSEAIAAVVKLMTEDELSAIARALYNPLPGGGTSIGSPAHFGSRIQPNSPGDDDEEVLFSILEGLSYGCGDVILGINPASDDLGEVARLEELLRSVVSRLELPTRYCVLSDIVKQTSARTLAKVDVGFQSLAGTSRALAGMVGLDADGVADLAKGFDGLYFETGQGSEVTNGADEGLDMVTLEARTYGLARHIGRSTGKWMIVNDVAGFIGPEVFRTGEQLMRACLEDCVMAKLHGLTMGLDVCSTFHMGIEPAALRLLTERIVERAAPAYLMAVAGNTDPMLGYMTTSFREHPRLRRLNGRQISTPMRDRLQALGLMDARGELSSAAGHTEALYALYMKAGGDSRSEETLAAEGSRKAASLKRRGCDLGYGHGPDFGPPPEVESRMDAIYSHARRALYAALDEGVLRDVSPANVRVGTLAADREQYLSDPSSGERINREGEGRLRSLYDSRRPQVQVVLSDGLNADAANENLRQLLPRLRRILAEGGRHVGAVDVVVRNGRVRAGYHAGALTGAEVVVHLIGERPGTGLNTLSAYLTYGRDEAGHLRWSAEMDHSGTTAVCGINAKGKRPEAAADEIARCVGRIFEERRSGVKLGASLS